MMSFIIWYKKFTTKWSEIFRQARESWLAEHRIAYTYEWIREMRERVDNDKKGMDLDIAKTVDLQTTIDMIQKAIDEGDTTRETRDKRDALKAQKIETEEHIEDLKKVYEEIEKTIAYKRASIEKDKIKVEEAKSSMKTLLKNF